MGATPPPNDIMPWAWSLKAETRELPGEPGIESEFGFWIEELSAWIAEDAEDAADLRAVLGSKPKIILRM